MSEEDTDLRERVAELEATVEQQSQTIRRMLPTRRDLLKAGAGSAVTGAAFLGATGTASAQVSDVADQDDSSFTVGDKSGESGDYVVDELYDPGGDKFLNVDDAGAINAQYGRGWAFDSLSTDSATVNGNAVLENRGESAGSATLGGGYVTPNSSRPTLVFANAEAETDGTTRGQVSLQVDQSGGTSLDYQIQNRISPEAGANTRDIQVLVAFVEPGGSYAFINDDDPTGTNGVNNVREVTL